MFIVSKKLHNGIVNGVTALCAGIGLFAISLTQAIPQMIAAGEMQRAEIMGDSFALAGLGFLLCVCNVVLLQTATHVSAVRHSKVYYAMFLLLLLQNLSFLSLFATAGYTFYCSTRIHQVPICADFAASGELPLISRDVNTKTQNEQNPKKADALPCEPPYLCGSTPNSPN